MEKTSRLVPFEEAVCDRTRLATKIQRSTYLPRGAIPVVDQGQEEIAGYTDDLEAAYAGALPVVLFGDHTRALKLVDVPFAAGADGVKVLEPRTDLDARFLWYFLRSRALPNDGYSRHFKHLRGLLIPIPEMHEQRRVVELLARAENIVRMRREAEQKAKEIIPALFLDMFGDPATNPKGWVTEALGAHIDLLTGYPFKSSEFVESGDTVRLCRGANVLPQTTDWSDVRHWPTERAKEYAAFALREGDIVLAMDRPWISTGLKVALVSRLDLPALLVQRVARIRPKQSVEASYIYFALSHPMFAAHCNAVKTETLVPHISPNDIRSFKLPIPRITLQTTFTSIVERSSSLPRALGQALALAEHAFQSLLAGVFGDGG